MVREAEPVASFSLRDFQAEIDAGKDTAALKQSAEVMYARATKEAVLHIRLHAQAVLNDVTATAPARAAAAQILLITDPLAARSATDPRWLELLKQ